MRLRSAGISVFVFLSILEKGAELMRIRVNLILESESETKPKHLAVFGLNSRQKQSNHDDTSCVSKYFQSVQLFYFTRRLLKCTSRFSIQTRAAKHWTKRGRWCVCISFTLTCLLSSLLKP